MLTPRPRLVDRSVTLTAKIAQHMWMREAIEQTFDACFYVDVVMRVDWLPRCGKRLDVYIGE